LTIIRAGMNIAQMEVAKALFCLQKKRFDPLNRKDPTENFGQIPPPDSRCRIRSRGRYRTLQDLEVLGHFSNR
jgi:hypothetical protein